MYFYHLIQYQKEEDLEEKQVKKQTKRKKSSPFLCPLSFSLKRNRNTNFYHLLNYRIHANLSTNQPRDISLLYCTVL
ncbi:hypothetical protein HYALB_00006647 [Hymenoscyphus albidus]|uniref:Uncharacterized protein n=1 Tax=Hymenoscyphus albidus TaxID=595503 RepID=A0A9N9M2E7_9HELO|nr:hypothetical protein HYALB_00006647 [Hymenoscyphus albidus]